jgi:pimeloyl-ACP methyl ester carboxylesterase
MAVVVSAVVAASCSRSGGSRRSPGQPVDRSPVTGLLENGDVRLSYRFEPPPDAPAPFPAVVIGHGSGEVRKNACWSLASNLLRRGFGVFCYDKRGVGESTGTYTSVGPINSHEVVPDLASDMAAGVRFLRARQDVDANRIGLAGGSQAGWIIPLAAKLSRANFMIILVGPTVTVGEEIYYSRFAEETTTPLQTLVGILPNYKGPRGFDPRPDLEEIATPGLWLLGGADRSIPTPETVAILDALIASGKPYTRKVYPGAGHGLQGVNIWPDVDDWLRRVSR